MMTMNPSEKWPWPPELDAMNAEPQSQLAPARVVALMTIR
jgi:hypothetical protein